MRQKAARRPEEADNPGSINPSAGAAPATPATSGEKNLPMSSNASSGEDKSETDSKSKVSEAVVGLVRAFQTSEPMKRFKQAYSKNNKPIRITGPPGCIGVRGIVDVDSKTTVLRVLIDTWYDPKTNTLVLGATTMEIRNMYRKMSLP